MLLRCAERSVSKKMQLAAAIYVGRLSRSDDQYGVSVAEEAVVFRNSLLVNFFDPGDAFGATRGEEGGYQAEEGGSGLVEIGNHSVHAN